MCPTFIALALLHGAAGGVQPSTAPLAAFTAPESAVRLERSKYKVDFFPLVNQFESQQNMGYCGPATAVIVLNALRVDNAAIAKPRDQALFPEQYRSRLPPGLDRCSAVTRKAPSSTRRLSRLIKEGAAR
jgi:Phytochelatin synthase